MILGNNTLIKILALAGMAKTTNMHRLMDLRFGDVAAYSRSQRRGQSGLAKARRDKVKRKNKQRLEYVQRRKSSRRQAA